MISACHSRAITLWKGQYERSPPLDSAALRTDRREWRLPAVRWRRIASDGAGVSWHSLDREGQLARYGRAGAAHGRVWANSLPSVRPLADGSIDPYGDPRVVALYDEDNPDGPDHDFYRSLAREVQARTIIDLGCGTGILRVTLAGPGRVVTGIDPSPSMLEFARARPGGTAVRWVLGNSTAIPAESADLVIMAGNVAQHILGDAWTRTLRDISAGLRPDATLAFESRNPSCREWETWTEPRTRTTRETRDGPLTEWLEVIDATDGQVTLVAHNVFESTREHLVVPLTLAFRTQDELEADLRGAGLRAVTIAGGWNGEAVQATSRVLVVTAGPE